MMRRLITMALLFVSGASFAQVIVNADSCRARALRFSEDVSIAESQYKMAEYKAKEQRANYLPKISASGAYAYTTGEFEYSTGDYYLPTYSFDPSTGSMSPNLAYNPATGGIMIGADGYPLFTEYAFIPSQTITVGLENAFMVGVQAKQPVYMGGKIRAANSMAAAGKDLAMQNSAKEKQKIVQEADQTYWNYVAVGEQLQVTKKYIELLDSLLNTVKHGVDVGMLHRNELMKVQVKYNDVQLQQRQAANARELLRMSLCRLMGYDFSTPIEVQDSIVEPDPNLANGNVMVESRPDYALLNGQIRMKEANEQLVRSDFLPQVGVAVSYNYLDGIMLNDSRQSNDGMAVLATVSIPLWQWGEGQNKLAAARIETEMAKASQQKYVKMMTLEAEQARLNLQEATFQIETTKLSLDQADENLRLSKNRYETGMELLSDYLEAQAQWQKAYATHISAKAELKKRETAYLIASGNFVAAP